MRKLLILLTAGLSVAAVVYRGRQAELEARQEIVSIRNEWARRGRPVDVLALHPKPLLFHTKVSAVVQQDRSLRAEVPQEVASRLRAGQKFTRCGAVPTAGRVAEVAPAPNVRSGLYGVRLTAAAPPRPGSIFVACVVTESLGAVLQVPKGAVQRAGAKNSVWIVADGKARRRQVTPGRSGTDTMRIRAGLRPGDQVVTAGTRFLEEGCAVSIRRRETAK